MDKEKRWEKFRQKLGYSLEELKLFRTNPRYVRMVEETPEYMTHKIIAEVVSSHGCIAQHKVGDRFVMDGNGILIAEECPPRMCALAIANLSKVVWIMYERFLEKLDPEGMIFPVIQCQDIGIDAGGWGKILMKVHIEGPAQRQGMVKREHS